MEKIILYGAGKYGHEWAEKIGSDHICAIVDKDYEKVGGIINGVPIKNIDSLDEINKNKQYKILLSLSERYLKSAHMELKEKGFGNCIIYSPYPEKILKIMDGAHINAGDSFEGRNYIGINSSLIDCDFGFASYVSDGVCLNNVKCGRFTSIAEGVSIIAGRHPSFGKYVSTHPAFFSINNSCSQVSFVCEQKFEEYAYTQNGYSCEIGNDVWIGKNVMVKEGTIIGDGAIIAAGAVVVKDVAPYDIVGGVPARKIRSRFSDKDVAFLLNLKWWEKEPSWIMNHSKLFCDIEEFKKFLKD